MTTHMSKRLGWTTVLFLVLAALWAAAQLVLAFFVHVTERAVDTPAGWVEPPTQTYIQAFAVSEVLLTVASLGLVALVGASLSRRGLHGEPGAGRLAWGISCVTALLGVVGFEYLFGVAVCLLLACATAARVPGPVAGRGSRPPTGAVTA